MRIARRQFVRVIGGCTVSILVAGCGRRELTVTPEAELQLTFSETDEFYNQLSIAIKRKQNVVLSFDGKHRVSENSLLLKEFIGKATNCEELWKIVERKDTEAGRKELEHVFSAELLSHKALNQEARLPSGEVVEPATVCLVLGIMLIAAAVAAAEINRNGKYRIGFRLAMTGMELYFQGEPQ